MTREELAAELKARIGYLRKRETFANERGYARAAEKNAARAGYYAGLLDSLKSGGEVEAIAYRADTAAQFKDQQRCKETAVWSVMQEYVRANAVETGGYYELRIIFSATLEANYETREPVLKVTREFRYLKDAIACARYVRAHFTGDRFCEALIYAGHFPTGAERFDRCGYELLKGGEETAFNEEVNGALVELADGDESAQPLSELDELKDRAADMAKRIGAEKAGFYYWAALCNLFERNRAKEG